MAGLSSALSLGLQLNGQLAHPRAITPLRDGLASASNKHLAAGLHANPAAASNALLSGSPEPNNMPYVFLSSARAAV